MSALDRKVIRDLLRMKGQALAIAVVMASGVATFVMSLSTLHSLEGTLEAYYEDYRFADVFARLTRAPDALADRIAEIPGVARVQTRVVRDVTLHMPDLAEPVVGRLISRDGARALNDLYLRRGRRLDPDRRREVLVSEGFAEAHDLHPGSTVTAVMNGRRETLRVVGVALSPEYIYQIRAGELVPDARRFGVFWIDREELAAAFDLDGAFNDVALRLMPGASEAEVIRRLDALVEPYGGLGAYGREDHLSHWFVSNEIRELRGMSLAVPSIFLAVAAFQLNVVLSRLVGTQREQIAVLKALGYGPAAVGGHFLKLVLAIVLVGLALGSVAGGWMGWGMTRLYTQFFNFPAFDYELEPAVIVLAFAASGGAAVAGTVGSVRRAIRLPAAEAMRPKPPAAYRPTLLERGGLARWLTPAARMVLRELERRPLRALLSCTAIAMATAVLVVGEYLDDGIDHALRVEFEQVQRQDVTVTLIEPRASAALAAISQLPGVRHAEPFRILPARLRCGHRQHRTGILGLSPGAELYRPLDAAGRPIDMPPAGLVLSETLAGILHVRPGEMVTVEVLEGERPVRRLPVAALVADITGTTAYADIETVNRLMRQDGVLNGAYVACAPGRVGALYAALRETPGVAGVTLRTATLESFHDTIAEALLLMKAFNVAFAVIIAVGVVYNNARISLSERNRELATLRVIGFSRGEISAIQLGELGVQTVVGIVPGLALGYGFAALITATIDTELFRIPLIVDRSTYAFAAAVVLAAALASGLLVRRMLDRLDLVAVLKSRE